jgi:hypothetical protein
MQQALRRPALMPSVRPWSEERIRVDALPREIIPKD